MGGGVIFFLSFWVGLYHHHHHHHYHHYHLSLSLSSYRSVQNLRTLGLIACEADRIGIRGSRSWSSTCAVSSVIPRLLLLTDFDKREHPTTATARRRLYGARRASRLFSTDFFFFFFFLFFFFFFFWGKEETVHEPLMIPLSSILHHTRTHTRPLDASRKHTQVARPSTAEAHTINQQKGQGHQKARGRDKRFSHLDIGRHGVLCPFVFDTASTQHPQSSSGMASSSCHCWPTLPVDSGHSGWFISQVSFLFPTNNNNKNNHSSCQPPPPPTHPRPPVLGLCQQQQQGASMGRTVSDSCWSATDPAGPALLGSSTK